MSQYDGSSVSSVDINAHAFFAVIMVSGFRVPRRARNYIIEHLKQARKSKTCTLVSWASDRWKKYTFVRLQKDLLS